MGVEGLKIVFDWAAVILLFLTFAAGVGVLITGNVINKRQSRELQEFRLRIEAEQQKTAKAQQDAAEAQKLLAQSLTRFVRRSGDRIADFNKLVEAFKDKPKGVMEVRYKDDDSEAKKFSEDIERAFQSIGWAVSTRPIKTGERLGGMQIDKLTGTFIFCRNDEQLKAFLMPFLSAFPFGTGAVGTSARELPDDRLVIVAGVADKL